METTTIEISNELKEKIASFGTKEESFEEILESVYSYAIQEQGRRFLMSEDGYISIEDAIKEVEKKWPQHSKSKKSTKALPKPKQ